MVNIARKDHFDGKPLYKSTQVIISDIDQNFCYHPGLDQTWPMSSLL